MEEEAEEADEKATADVDAERAAKVEAGGAADALAGAAGAGAGAGDEEKAAPLPRTRIIEEVVVDMKVLRVPTMQVRLAPPPSAPDARVVALCRVREGALPINADDVVDDSIADYVEYSLIAGDTLKSLEMVVLDVFRPVLEPHLGGHGAWSFSGACAPEASAAPPAAPAALAAPSLREAVVWEKGWWGWRCGHGPGTRACTHERVACVQRAAVPRALLQTAWWCVGGDACACLRCARVLRL